MTNTDDVQDEGISPFKRAALVIGGVLLSVFALGVIVGYTKAAIEGGNFGWKALLVYLLAGALVLGGLWMIRRGLTKFALPKSPRMREYQLIVLGTCLLGAVLGGLMQIGAPVGTEAGLNILTYHAPISPAVAAVMLASLPLLAWLYYRWHKTADEHEQAAYNFGAVLGIYTYFFASIGWWVAWRGGLLPEPNGVAIFWTVIIVWSIGWIWHRFR
ncbi:MAG: hypothetical protein ACKOUT_12135 [Novosphingobium sp.]